MSAADVVIESLADECAALRERASLAAAYREALQEAIARLGVQTQELESARRRIAALVDENRALRDSGPA